MTKVVLAFSISLDGFVAGPNISRQHPMGEGGAHLHEWLFASSAPGNEIDAEAARNLRARAGAVVLGRRTYEIGVDLWEDTPYPVPSFVLTHEPHLPRLMKSASFTFVTDGVGDVIARARAAAGGRDVIVMGADTARQVLAAGLADETVLQIVPILLGAGARLFDGVPPGRLHFSPGATVASGRVSHVSWQVAAG